MSTEEINIVRVAERINHLEKLHERQEKDLMDACIAIKDLRNNMDGFIRDIHRDIAAIRIELAKPIGVGWNTAITLNILSVMVTALTVYLLTGGSI